MFFAAGCRTSEDAAAAAAQMSATAKSLSEYYSAVGTILTETDQINSLDALMFSKPYPAENQQALATTEAELAKRAKLAADFSTLASNFGKLTGSTAPADVATAAGKLESECGSLAGFKASDPELSAMKIALQLLVTAVQERKEREAAKALDSFTQGLSGLFEKEAPTWNSLEETYASQASTLAKDLVDRNAVDNSWVLKVALDPFGLAPAVPSADLNKELAEVSKKQIDTRTAALDSGYVSATDAMTKALQEMARRVHLVAEDKAMSFRVPPPSVETVEQWASKVMSQ